MSATTARTAMLVDQHPLWLDTVAQVAEQAGVEVVAQLTSSTAAAERIGELQPALLITGIEMRHGEIDGIALTRHVRERVPDIRTIILSMYEDRRHIDLALAAGADAYVFKSAHRDDLVSAIRQAFHHSVYLAGPRQPVEAAVAPLALSGSSAGLTRRELEILRLVAEGHSNAQLAGMLWVTEQTVKFHLSNIYRKLGVVNRTEAGRWAQLHGLLGSPPHEPADARVERAVA
jgi:DNA-binding NarL/FixJ family response regulator